MVRWRLSAGITLVAMEIDRLAEGNIVEPWEMMDALSVRQPLGAIAATG